MFIMDKKYYWIFGILLLSLLIIIGCSQNSKLNSQIPEEKYCNTDSDCRVQYNVLFNGKCSADCFNINVSVDRGCTEKYKWELMVNNCVCKNHECQKSS